MKTAETKNGLIEGLELDGYTLYKGIPYAEPPVGDLRFKPPVPFGPWEGILEAFEWGNMCLQATPAPGSFREHEWAGDNAEYAYMDEDCLYLNIWSPAKKPDDKLPVAVWIHGGSFNHGFGHSVAFDGAAMAKRGVILVTINYRLGVFGFLAHKELAAESERGISGNYGLLDQIEALKWVRDNIAAFGGDPSRITIFGQSAGALSGQLLVSSPETEDMIAGAIFQSGAGYRSFGKDLPTTEKAEEMGAYYLEKAGVSSIEELRALPGEKLLEAQLACQEGLPLGVFFGPYVDGVIVPYKPDRALELGKVKAIPYMIGATLNDMGEAEAPEGERGMLYNGSLNMAGLIRFFGRGFVYVYDFARQLPGDESGAFHSSELWYMFGTQDKCWRPFTEADKALSEKMLDLWTTFMKTGEPEGKDWPVFRGNPGEIKVFDVE
ncbi:MAG: carboxylesterase family protein [Lachnospiraceae bacterium]|nr:carboxylesterase family protein [Lachnospiraceae bacterium]